MFSVPEKRRLKQGALPSTKEDGNNGVFVLPGIGRCRTLYCIASDGEGWEHVSVTARKGTPTWEEMARVKKSFWDESDFVVQMHPPKEDYINNHPGCLHLWRKAGTNEYCERPASILVGFENLEVA